MRIYRSVWKYLKKFKAGLCIYICCCIVYSLTMLATPYISGNFIDILTKMKNTSELYNYCFLFAAISLSSVVINFAANRIYMKLQVNISHSIIVELIHKINKVDISFVESQNCSGLSQKIHHDTRQVTSFVLMSIQSILVNMLTFILPFIVLSILNIFISITMLVLIMLYCIAYNLFKTPLYKVSYGYREEETAYFNSINEQITSAKFSRMRGISQWFLERMKYPFKKMYSKSLKYQKVSYLFMSLDKIVLTIAQIVLFFYGGSQVISGNLTIGTFTIIMSYFNMIIASIRYFFNMGKSIQESSVCLQRIDDILNVDEVTEGEEIINDVNKIALYNISFVFGENKVIDNFTGAFSKGNIYIIKGVNGSGKSTLLKIIMGMYLNNYSGEVYYDDKELRELNMDHVRKQLIGFAEQDPYLFKDTIYSNVSLDQNCDTQAILFRKLFKLLRINNISGIDEKLSIPVNDIAANYSGGEKERIILMRSLLKMHKVLLLDEPTASLDKETKANLLEYFLDIKKDKIIIISTHDHELIDIGDSIIEL